MSKYYIFEYACGTKETGPEYPQVQKMGKDYNYDAPDSIYEVGGCTTQLPKFVPNFDHFVLHKKAKPTDFISNALITNTGFMVSNRVKNLFSSFKLPIHKFYPVKILHGKTWLDDYNWLQIVPDLSGYIDYQKSEFYKKNLAKVIASDLGSVEVKSKEDLEIQLKELDTSIAIWAKRIVMNKEFDKELDFFRISRVNSNTFISERLNQAMQEAKLTGVKTTPTELVSLPYSFEMFN